MSKLVFDPFSEQHYNGPYEAYRCLRDEAPVYYSVLYDFCAVSSNPDVAAAFKDFDTDSSSRGDTLEEIQFGQHKRDQSIIWMDPPAHRRLHSLVNKVFDERAFTRCGCVRSRPRPHRGAGPRLWLRHPQLPGRRAGWHGMRCRGGIPVRLHGRSLEVDGDGLRRVAMTGVIGYENVPVQVR